MTNAGKAKQITNAFYIGEVSEENEQVIREMLNKAALEAMQWKDKQFAEEKQQWIEKAMKVICDGCAQKVECEFNNWKTCSTKDELIKAIGE